MRRLLLFNPRARGTDAIRLSRIADRKLGGLCVDVEPRFGPNFGYAKTPDNTLEVVVISDYVILLDRLEILT